MVPESEAVKKASKKTVAFIPVEEDKKESDRVRNAFIDNNDEKNEKGNDDGIIEV